MRCSVCNFATPVQLIGHIEMGGAAYTPVYTQEFTIGSHRSHFLLVRMISYSSGIMSCPVLLVDGLMMIPVGAAKLYLCMRWAIVRCSSVLATASPTHTRRPVENGSQEEMRGPILPSSVRKRSGLKAFGSSQCFGSMCTAQMLGITWVPLGML